MKKKSSLTPVKLRIMLSCILFVTAAIGVAIYMLGYQQIASNSSDAQKLASQAQASNSDLNNLTLTKKLLDTNADTVNRTSLMIAESKQYSHQDQIVIDLYKYASEAGVTITNITFPDTKNVTTSPAASAAGPISPAATAPAGIKSVQTSFTLSSPVPYTNVLKFIHLLEQGLFKMRLTQVGISSSSDSKSAGMVSVDALTVEAFVRS